MNKKTLLAALLGLAFATTANAGYQSGYITQLNVRSSDGLVWFVLSGAASGKPACATHGYWMIANENSEVGKKQYALLLQAQATGKQVSVWGSNTCNRWGDGEDMDLITTTE